MELGIMVVRGPDWKWDDEDGGEGHVGTVAEVEKFSRFSVKSVTVKWDSGSRNDYRVGCEGACDLRIVDNAPSGVKHPGIQCNFCNVTDIAGMRWKCRECENFNLCTQCYMSDKHDLTHPFLRYERESPFGIDIPPRKGAAQIVKKGIFVSAKVIRGPDWNWGDQDGGTGKEGIVIEIRSWSDSGRAAAHVVWPSGDKNTYRVGYKGKMDLKCIGDGIDGSYYRDHLPVMGDEERTNETESCENITLGETGNEKGGENITEDTEDDTFTKNCKSWSLLSQNLETLFLNDQFCDFTVKVQGRVFQIHKTILGARSPVFASMLQHDMKEKKTGIVEISDCDQHTFEDFLFYLYSGKTERISQENATGLYELADKYDVQGLKVECVQLMKGNLSVDIFCDAIALAVRHGDKELIKTATEYFISNAKEILQTVKWQIFMKDNSVIANELYIKAFNTASSKN